MCIYIYMYILLGKHGDTLHILMQPQLPGAVLHDMVPNTQLATQLAIQSCLMRQKQDGKKNE